MTPVSEQNETPVTYCLRAGAIRLVAPTGIDPVTFRFSVGRSTN